MRFANSSKSEMPTDYAILVGVISNCEIFRSFLFNNVLNSTKNLKAHAHAELPPAIFGKKIETYPLMEVCVMKKPRNAFAIECQICVHIHSDFSVD